MSAERKALAGAASDGSVVGSCAVTYRLPSRPMRATACRFRVRWPMLEPYAGKLACTVLRGGSGGDAAPLPDRRRNSASVGRGSTPTTSDESPAARWALFWTKPSPRRRPPAAPSESQPLDSKETPDDAE